MLPPSGEKQADKASDITLTLHLFSFHLSHKKQANVRNIDLIKYVTMLIYADLIVTPQGIPTACITEYPLAMEQLALGTYPTYFFFAINTSK